MRPTTVRRMLADLLLVSAAVAFFSWAAVHGLEVLRAAENWASDFRVTAFSPPAQPSDKIVVLAINEETLSGFPYRSPVRRDFLAALLRFLDGAGARAVGVDLIFDQETERDADMALSDALRTVRVPLVVSVGNVEAALTDEQLEYQENFLEGVPTGLANLLKDSDDVVRRIHPGAEEDGVWRDSFPGALARVLGRAAPQAPVRMDYRRPLAGKPAFVTHAAHNARLLPSHWFTGKVVLIGSDLPQQDRHLTPLRVFAGERKIPGVTIHAHALDQLLEGRRFRDTPPWVAAALLGGFVLLGALIAWLDFPWWLKIVASAAILVVLGVSGCLLYRRGGPAIPLVLPAIGFAASLATSGAYVGRRVKASERYIRRAFGQYLSPRVIERLIADPDQLALGGEKREMTFLFSDIAGFTTLSERLPAEQLVGLLQVYLDQIVEIVLRHDGTIDKFIGDAVVVLFGAPSDQEDHAQRAVSCAFDMDRFAEEFRAAQQREGISFGVTRIGVHTGVATVGNLGGRRRFDYTAIGDAVNTAARLESVNKHLGTRVCISGEAAKRWNGRRLRPVGTLVLKGKEQGLEAYSPIDDASESRIDEYTSAFHALETGSSRALELFRRLAEKYPTDGLIAFHLGRLLRGESGARIVLEQK